MCCWCNLVGGNANKLVRNNCIQMEYWEILLKKQRERGKNGLTIPFLLGSQQYLPANSNQDITGLIQDMATRSSLNLIVEN